MRHLERALHRPCLSGSLLVGGCLVQVDQQCTESMQQHEAQSSKEWDRHVSPASVRMLTVLVLGHLLNGTYQISR